MGREIMNAGGEGGDHEKMGWSSSPSPSSSPSSSSSSLSSLSSELPLLSLNHVSFVCKSVPKSVKFYEEVLGFVLIKRPSSFDFEGAWLFNYGLGIHLLESENAPAKKEKINPKDNHISFQTPDMGVVMKKLEEMNIEFVTAVVKEGGVTVDQLFFHDPDGYMVEICNCQNLPVLPLSTCPIPIPSKTKTKTTTAPPAATRNYWKGHQCGGEVEALMMENLVVDMMDISF